MNNKENFEAVEKENCQLMIANILLHIKEVEPQMAVINIAQIMKTGKCKDFHNLETIRNTTEEQINASDPERMKRILEDRANEQDMIVAQRVMCEYRSWYIKRLGKNMTWRSWYEHEVQNNSDFYISVLGGVTTTGITAAAGWSPFVARVAGAAAAMCYKKVSSWFSSKK